jgi:hypothetical protein
VRVRMQSKLVYDESLLPTTVTFTNTELNDFLGRHDQISIQAVVDQVVTAGYLIVHVEHSADGRNFVLKGPAIDNLGIGPGFGGFAAFATTVLTGADQGIFPSLGFVRLRIVNVSLNPVHVKIHVTMRDQSGAVPGTPDPPEVPTSAYGDAGAALVAGVRKKLPVG